MNKACFLSKSGRIQPRKPLNSCALMEEDYSASKISIFLICITNLIDMKKLNSLPLKPGIEGRTSTFSRMGSVGFTSMVAKPLCGARGRNALYNGHALATPNTGETGQHRPLPFVQLTGTTVLISCLDRNYEHKEMKYAEA